MRTYGGYTLEQLDQMVPLIPWRPCDAYTGWFSDGNLASHRDSATHIKNAVCSAVNAAPDLINHIRTLEAENARLTKKLHDFDVFIAAAIAGLEQPSTEPDPTVGALLDYVSKCKRQDETIRELRDENARLTRERDERVKMRRITEHPELWEDGSTYIVGLRVVVSDKKTGEMSASKDGTWQFYVVTIRCDEDWGPEIQDENGDDIGWAWSDMEVYLPASDLSAAALQALKEKLT